MNKSQIIGGIICLILAAFLQLLAIVLSPEKLWLTIMLGSLNVSLPAVALLILGMVLLFTKRKQQEH